MEANTHGGDVDVAVTSETLAPHRNPCLPPPRPIVMFEKCTSVASTSVPAVGTSVPTTSETLIPCTPPMVRPMPGLRVLCHHRLMLWSLMSEKLRLDFGGLRPPNVLESSAWAANELMRGGP